jgi:Na+-transporting methylmalonyl-CoA/oxaloacetate decarboxylase gamma subunit
MGCSFEETTVVSKKTPPQTKTPAKIYKKQIPAPKKVNIPITKDDKTKMIPMSFPMMPWTLRFFDRKSEVIEDGESKETPSQDSFGQQIPDLMSLSRDPFGLLTRLFKNPILLPDPDSVKITKSTVTVYGTEDGGNDVEILKSDSSNPGVIERTFFSQPIDFIEGDSTSGKKSASPSTEKIEMSAPKPTMHLPETSEQTVPINSIKMSYEKKLTGKVTSEMEKPQGEILGFLVFVFVFMSILLIMTKYQSKKDNLYFPLPLNKDNEKSSSLFEDEDDDDEDELVKLIKRVGKLERQDVSLISSSPPSYEETQKTPVLKVSLDATASSNEDRFSKLAEKC